MKTLEALNYTVTDETRKQVDTVINDTLNSLDSVSQETLEEAVKILNETVSTANVEAKNSIEEINESRRALILSVFILFGKC